MILTIICSEDYFDDTATVNHISAVIPIKPFYSADCQTFYFIKEPFSSSLLDFSQHSPTSEASLRNSGLLDDLETEVLI